MVELKRKRKSRKLKIFFAFADPSKFSHLHSIMAKPAKFVINYAPQVRKGPISSPSISIELTLLQNYKPVVRSVANTSNRINFVSEQSYPQGTFNGDTQTGNVVPGSTFYLVLKALRNLKGGYRSSIPSTMGES
jgi:hypothetical protein